jgi:hypothetical protein
MRTDDIKDIKDIAVSGLVELFTSIAIDQDKALFNEEIAKFNKLYGQMEVVRDELKRRPGDQRRALLALYQHPNMQVRLKAAVSTLAVSPQPARDVVESIARSRQQPQAGDAGMLLRGLDDGSFVPS